MAIVFYLVGASTSEKSLDPQQFLSLIGDLIQKKFAVYPATIFVGDVTDDPEIDRDYYRYIVPNHPDGMTLLIEECEDKALIENVRYDGDDEQSFLKAYSQLSFDRNICICLAFDFGVPFHSYQRDGTGIALYSLVDPFPVVYVANTSSFRRTLSQFIVFYTNTGSLDSGYIPLIRPIIEKHFGPNALLEYASDFE